MSIGRKVVLQEQVCILQQIQLSLQGLLNTSPLLCDDFEISCYLSIGRFLIPINFFYISFNKLLINNRKVKRYKEEGIERDNILYIGLSLYRGKSCLCFIYRVLHVCISYIWELFVYRKIVYHSFLQKAISLQRVLDTNSVLGGFSVSVLEKIVILSIGGIVYIEGK